MSDQQITYRGEKEDTVHRNETPYGKKTVHKYPQTEPSISDIFLQLNNDLYPTGRVWQNFDASILKTLHQALNASFIRLVEDSVATINSTFPDTELFNEDDVLLWEYRLGLITNTNIDLDIRREAVLRKLAFPNNIQPRQSRIYIEHQLQLAGFDVLVLENSPPYRTPDDVLGDVPGEIQHADDIQHGDNTQSGGANFEVIANSIEPGENFAIGGDDKLYATFFIVRLVAGIMTAIDTEVPQSREREFRELVLKLKPASTVAYILRE